MSLSRTLFQSTLPREERLCSTAYFPVYRYFNPRSHERSDIIFSAINKIAGYISIHAPTRGATKGLNNLKPQFNISIHAPTRGATQQSTTLVNDNIFQSTLPREERQKALKTYAILLVFQSTLPREERRMQKGRIE